MLRHDAGPPELVPVLSAGKHRNPRKGACFMELASYLAGERWSDHPACTHPLLAALARLVNDHTSDEARGQLAPLVPSVVGVTSDDPLTDVAITVRAATSALPIAAAGYQQVLAVALLAVERTLAGHGDPSVPALAATVDRALAGVPAAASWARGFTSNVRLDPAGFRRHTAPSAIRFAVTGIARASVPDPDRVLRDLLGDAIAEVTRRAGGAAVPGRSPDHDWRAMCSVAGSRPSTAATP